MVAIAAGSWFVWDADADLDIRHDSVAGTPVSAYSLPGAPPGPVVLIAHGFAGSRQFMRPFAATLAHAGYQAVTFDFRGHGKHPEPLSGDIDAVDGATEILLGDMAQVAAWARQLPGGDGRIAVLGHSMAADLVVRFAQRTPDVAATVAVSMFSPAVTADSPRNLLVIVGEWEPETLRNEGLRVVGLLPGVDTPQEGVTYGDIADGSARRVAFADNVEHVAVLYSTESMREARDWLDQAFGRDGGGGADARGPWVLLLVMGFVLLARPMATWLPVVSPVPVGGAGSWGMLAAVSVAPTLFGPVLLHFLPTDFLPVLIADYLAAHFAMFGILTGVGLWLAQRQTMPWHAVAVPGVLFGAAGAIAAYAIGTVGLTVDKTITSFIPIAGRVPAIAALFVGALLFFLADEWLTRGPQARRGAFAVTKILFVISLLLAIAIDLNALGFLFLILPAIVAAFIVFGLFSAWAYRQTNHPLPGALANAFLVAWTIGVIIPQMGG